MLDHRVYRGAFLPALVVLVVAAFSLVDRPAASTTRVAPDAFDGARAAATVDALAREHRDRSAGSAGDLALAERVQRGLVATGFADAEAIRTSQVVADTPDGQADMRVVLAERQGLSSRRVVVVAHRDAAAGSPDTTLSGTAVLLELARVLADRDLRITVVLASVSGTTAGYEGAREAVRLAGEPVEAVLVLGDLASQRTRRPWVVPWALAGDPAPHGLRRTVEAALRKETGQPPGSVRAVAQWARRAVPVTVSPQGVVGAEGLPAVLVSATGELGPRPGDRVSRARLQAFGRAVLRAFSAIEGARPGAGPGAEPDAAEAESQGIVTLGRLLPDWAIRLVVIAFLLPALLAAVDGIFRARRRREPARRWLAWAAAFTLPFLLAWGWLRLLDVSGAVEALSAPAAPGATELGRGAAIALASIVVVLLLGFVGVRAWRLRPSAGTAAGGAAAVGLLGALLVLGVWVANPYAAGVLLPAAHLWLLVPASSGNPRRPVAAAAVAAGLVLPLLVGAYFAVTLELSATEALRLVFDLLAGGEAGFLDALSLAGLLGLTVAALVLIAERPRADGRAAAPMRTRGPRGYAGPGSLGGTESALRR